MGATGVAMTTDGADRGRSRRRLVRLTPIVAIVAIQALSAVLFIANIAFSVIGAAPVAWILYELTEIGAAVGLILGMVLGGIALRRSLRRAAEAEARLRAAQGAFMTLLEERLDGWGLT
ncbi:hypothetical protein, partial [Corallococcus praedator]